MIAHHSNMEQQRRKGRLIATNTKLNDKLAHKTTCGTRQGWKKPPGAPKQPLSAYNLFYQCERQRILSGSSTGTTARPPQLGFAPLTRCIADRWKLIDPTTRKHFEQLAAKDRTRYLEEKKVWTNKTKTPLPPSPIPVASCSSPILSNVQVGKILDAWSDDDDCFINQKVDAIPITFNDDSSSSSSQSSFFSDKAVEPTKPQLVVMPYETTHQNNNMACVDTASSPTAAQEAFWHPAERRTTAPVECLCPIPLTELNRYTSLSQLATALGNESIDLLLGLLDC